MEIAKRDRAEQLDGKLLQGDPWIEVAEFASYHCQIHALNLKPWQSPPCTEDEEDSDPEDKAAQKLLRRMLAAGVSRYDPRASRRRSTRRPKAQLPPRQRALVDLAQSQNGGHFLLSWVVPTRKANPSYFFTAAAVLHLGERYLHLGIGRPLAALPDPLEFISFHYDGSHFLQPWVGRYLPLRDCL